MNQYEYENNERRLLCAQLQQIEKAPLNERKEAMKEFQEVLKDCPLIAERIEWIFEGNYGFGAQQFAKEILKQKRMNRVANLSALVARLEWNCPARMCIQAYKNLTKIQQIQIDTAIKALIAELEKQS
jgi:hypothetical protein